MNNNKLRRLKNTALGLLESKDFQVLYDGFTILLEILEERNVFLPHSRECYDMDEILIFSAQMGDFNIVKFALKEGADIHAKDEKCLRLAVEFNHPEVVKYLLQSGAQIPVKYGNQLLHSASFYGYTEVAKLLVEYRGNIRSKENRAVMITALEAAKQNGFWDLVTFYKAILN
jgi:hypothetical protein